MTRMGCYNFMGSFSFLAVLVSVLAVLDYLAGYGVLQIRFLLPFLAVLEQLLCQITRAFAFLNVFFL